MQAFRPGLLAAVVLAAPFCAHGAEVSVAFGGPGVAPPFNGTVSAQGSQQIDNATYTADFWGAGSLASGAMLASVGATPHSVFLSSPAASSSVFMHDLLKIVGPGASPVPLQLRMDVDALMTVDPGMGANDGVTLWLSTLMSVDSALSSSMEIHRVKSYFDTGAINEDLIECVGQPCDVNQPLTTAGVIDGQFVLNLQATPGFFFSFTAYSVVSTYSNPEVWGEVQASQHISYVLPAGYTLSSQSGAFLTSPIPEPATAMLALLGCAVLAFRVRAAGPRRQSD